MVCRHMLGTWGQTKCRASIFLRLGRCLVGARRCALGVSCHPRPGLLHSNLVCLTAWAQWTDPSLTAGSQGIVSESLWERTKQRPHGWLMVWSLTIQSVK